MTNRIVSKANKMMIMVLLNVLEGQIVVEVCLRFNDVQCDFACSFKILFKKY